ncbi:hypothetical protein B9Z19DRAFT_1127360 [Tuber borchii]|uniref:Uncharacterized protein n=1 Tax=Tuber borchii TaxID=42251 RepID=A0A2T6ZRC2_TUBBO|nr:hypothetical protein B9Z19DRAFT_1127360 [Tuber borchii]
MSRLSTKKAFAPRSILHYSPQARVLHSRRGITTAFGNGSHSYSSGNHCLARITDGFKSPTDGCPDGTYKYFSSLSSQNVIGGKIIRDLTALHSEVGAVSASNCTVSNKREYHSNRMDPYPTSPSIWPETSTLLTIFTSVCIVGMVGCLVQFSYCLGILEGSIRITMYNQQQKGSKASS